VIPALGQIEIPVLVNSFRSENGQYNFDINFEFTSEDLPSYTFDLEVNVLPDDEPPAPITDLTLVEITSSSAVLTWTNTGDDGLEGNSSLLELAYSQDIITNESWDALPKLSISPNGTGLEQQVVIPNLQSNAFYNFAVKVTDNSGNISELSNISSGNTLIGPLLEVFPETFNPVVLMQDETTNLELQLSNLGDEVLSYTLNVLGVDGAEPTAQKANADAIDFSVELAKGEEDLRTSSPVISGSGGPDAYGYTWADSDEGGVTYDWQDIAGIGTPMTFSDDSVRGPFDLGFDFDFYGETQTQVWVSSNGFLSFSSVSNGCCSGQPIPSADSWNNIIAWAWDDLYPRSGYSAVYLSEADKFTIQFTNYGEYGASGLVTAQIILFADGRIKFQYKEFTNGFDTLRSSIGIENADGTDGLQVAFNTAYLHDELAIEFSNGPEWLSLSDTSGEIEAGLSNSIDLTFDATGQPQGTHEAELKIFSNDVSQPAVVIPLRMDVVLPE